MFAVLQIEPRMARGECLLVTRIAGVGGSLLSTCCRQPAAAEM